MHGNLKMQRWMTDLTEMRSSACMVMRPWSATRKRPSGEFPGERPRLGPGPVGGCGASHHIPAGGVSGARGAKLAPCRALSEACASANEGKRGMNLQCPSRLLAPCVMQRSATQATPLNRRLGSRVAVGKRPRCAESMGRAAPCVMPRTAALVSRASLFASLQVPVSCLARRLLQRGGIAPVFPPSPQAVCRSGCAAVRGSRVAHRRRCPWERTAGRSVPPLALSARPSSLPPRGRLRGLRALVVSPRVLSTFTRRRSTAPKFGRTEFGRNGAAIGRIRRSSGQVRLNSGQLLPTKVGPISTDFDPNSATVDAARDRRRCRHCCWTRQTAARNRPTLARLRPDLANFDQH